MLLADARRQVVETCRRAVEDRLVIGTAGNVSVRVGDLVAVTPTGLDYGDLTPDLVGVHELDGTAVEAPLKPTSELPMHLAVYADTDAKAVVHTHSIAAAALSAVVDEVPAVHYYLALLGGRVLVAPYRAFGSPELAAALVDALGDRSACLLGNHGAVTTGVDLAQAYQRAGYLEWVCEVALKVLGTGHEPTLLSRRQMDEAVANFVGYGQSAGDGLQIGVVVDVEGDGGLCGEGTTPLGP
ncbi:class II aldolase/adducin family protein [Kutzneria buriramensis]|uniref:L-fuculose-phosphate aldolase n=1 Tax=Kutzneria buriramensis TaxID=1045776 RepID=A0A3E0HV48_9PSEU|nr:class II aldolase/adducin family protein [Kutzneria buriramensis]REH50126.1 L-fuculose-phosphate aldolase [Kutzneria buriramensis]